jgi:hypothetical protein
MRESTPAYDEAVPDRVHLSSNAVRNPFDSPTSSTVKRTGPKNPFEDDDNTSTQSTTSLFDENRFPLQLAPPP